MSQLDRTFPHEGSIFWGSSLRNMEVRRSRDGKGILFLDGCKPREFWLKRPITDRQFRRYAKMLHGIWYAAKA